MADDSKSRAENLAAALSELKDAAARRRLMTRGTPEYGAAVAAEVELSQAVYELTLEVRRAGD